MKKMLAEIQSLEKRLKAATAPPEELSAHDVSILKAFYKKFKEMRNSLNHVFDLGSAEIHRLKSSEEHEQWLMDDISKALQANRHTIDLLAKVDADFISIFKKRPEVLS